MIQPELVPPRTVSAPVTVVAPDYRPWYEVSARVEARIAEWDWQEASWHHWAVPAKATGAELAGAREFDPGLRAASPGTPERAGHPSPPLDAALAGELAQALVGRLRPVVFRQATLGLTSGLDENREAFRRRCLAVIAPAVRSGGVSGESGAAAMASLREAIEERRLDKRELQVAALRVGIGWYPRGTEPGRASSELLVNGPVRGA